MKKTGICPRCEFNVINGPYRTGTKGSKMPFILNLSFLHSAKLETYTCANCGYTEYYADEKGIKNLRLKGKPYSP